jgi:hypothetical protein
MDRPILCQRVYGEPGHVSLNPVRAHAVEVLGRRLGFFFVRAVRRFSFDFLLAKMSVRCIGRN